MSRSWKTALAGLGLLALGVSATAPARAEGRAGGAEGRAEGRADEGPLARAVERVRLLAGGSWLGVSIDDVDAEALKRLGLDQERGALVEGVESDSPAEKAGLKADDVILGFQGERVRSAAQLARLVRETPPGREVALEIWREGARRELEITLEKPQARRLFEFRLPGRPLAPHPPEAPEPPEPPEPPFFELFDGEYEFLPNLLGGPRRLGLSYQPLGEQLAQYFQVEAGVLVTEVEPGGPAAKAGVKAGDVIVAFDADEVESGSDLRRAVRSARAGSDVKLGLVRGGKPLELTVTLAGERRLEGPSL